MRNKKLLTTLLALLLTATTATPFLFSAAPVMAQAEETATETTPQYEEAFSYMDILQAQYDDIVEHAENCNVTIDEDLTFNYYVESYYAQNAMLASEFLSYILENISYLSTTSNPVLESETLSAENIPATLSSGTLDWWENIPDGTALPKKPVYDYFLFNLERGDIVSEQGVGSGDLATGHTAIIQGDNEDASYGIYWSVIESLAKFNNSGTPIGVCRGVIDNDRIAKNKSTIYRVTTNVDKNIATTFCENQIGDGYTIQTEKVTSADSWMCSTLVWAGYKNAGIDLCPNATACFPWDLEASPYITEVECVEWDYYTFEITAKHTTLFTPPSWSVKIINYNTFITNGFYNSRLCFKADAKNFNEPTLSDEVYITNPANGYHHVYINHNGTAGYITAGYTLTLGSSTYKIITYANNIDYTAGVGSCIEYHNIVKV